MAAFEQNPELSPFAEAISSFVDGEVDAEGFAQRYRELFDTDTLVFGGGATKVLNALFRDVDAFTDAGTIDETGLRSAAGRALDELRALDRA